MLFHDDMILGFPTALGQESFNGVPYSIDEFKVWNFDKVEFGLCASTP